MPTAATAQVVITEIMYDLKSGSDSGREWIEVFNIGKVPIKGTDLKLFENGTNHNITAAAGGDTIVPNSYAVIADNTATFKVDWPEFSGQLFYSVFSLSNEGETITLRNASSSDIDALSYQSSSGGGGDGNSLDRMPGDTSLVPRSPTPGATMSASAIPPPSKPVSVTKTKTIVAKNSPTRSAATDRGYSSDIISDTPVPGTLDPDAAATEVAAVASGTPDTPYLWWAAAGALALFAAGSLVAVRYFSKREWDIVEETGE